VTEEVVTQLKEVVTQLKGVVTQLKEAALRTGLVVDGGEGEYEN